jgi:hypothetical protein
MESSRVVNKLELVQVSKDKLQQYVDLFKLCFPNSSLTLEYLDWLYFQNPQGFVVGYDAINNGRVVAHYACIPIEIEGFSQKCLLSVNTATHPDFQGLGIFKLIAQQTYDTYTRSFSSVIGVANGNSEKTFIEKLGFMKFGNLDLRFGNLVRERNGSRRYSDEDCAWISQCPGRNLMS